MGSSPYQAVRKFSYFADVLQDSLQAEGDERESATPAVGFLRTPLLVLRRAVREDEDAVRADRLRVHELQGLRLFRVPEEALAAPAE